MKYKAFIFDWDGTLVDSEAHIVSCLKYAAQQSGLPVLSYDKFKDIIGLGMREALLSLYPALSNNEIEDMRGHYSASFFAETSAPLKLFDGVIDTLKNLQSKGLSLAVATGKSRNGLNKALLSTGLQPFFDIERCADETRSKPHPLMLEEIAEHFSLKPSEMLMIGDTEYDLEMAACFDMDAVGVSYGVHDVSRLMKHKPVKIIDSLSEILTLT